MAPAATNSSSSNQAFAGNLGSKNKGELIDILKSLGQPVTGLKFDLEERLSEYLESNEETLREDGRYKGLFVARGGRNRRGRSDGESATPTPQPNNASPSKHATSASAVASTSAQIASNAITSAASALPSSETITNHLDNLYQAGAKTVQRLKPSVDQAVEEGQEAVARGARKGVRAVKEVEPRDLGLPESPVRALRSKANQAADAAAPVIQDGLERAQHGAENAAHRGLKYWRDSGERDLREVIKNGQAYLSESKTLVRVSLFLELVYLLLNLVPFHRYELQFPPSQFSWHASARLLYSLFWWFPEVKAKIPYPEIFAMLKPSSNASSGFWMWLFITVIPPFLLSHVISFLEQPHAAHSRKTRSKSRTVAPLPNWDPLTFTIIRFAICLLPITSAAPDLWRYQLEALGSTSGRALYAGLTAAFVVAERLAALV